MGSQALIRYEHGSIWTGDGRRIIENPAILFDPQLGSLHAWGDAPAVQRKYERWTMGQQRMGVELFPALTLLVFDKLAMSNEEIYHTLKRMLEDPAYRREFCRRTWASKEQAGSPALRQDDAP